jgi:maltose-binding protein MalE
MKRIIMALAAVVLLLTVTACGASAAANDVDSEEAVSSEEWVESGETTLETMVKSENFQGQVEELSKTYEDKGMELRITAEGNTLIYTCAYTVDGVDTEEAKTALAEYLDSDTMTKSIEEVLEYVRRTVPETESVKVVYVDNGGKEIVSKEYK